MHDRLNQYDINEGILECSNRSPANKEKEHQIAPCSNTLRNVNEGHQEGTDDRRRDAANSVQEHRLVQDSLTSSDKIEVLQDRGRRDSHEKKQEHKLMAAGSNKSRRADERKQDEVSDMRKYDDNIEKEYVKGRIVMI